MITKLVVEFQTAHAEIPPSYSDNIHAFAKYLADNPGSMADIRGYADHTGHGPANGAVGEETRRTTVKDYLGDALRGGGLQPHHGRRVWRSVGEEVRNNTEEGKQLNRSATVRRVVETKS